MKRRTRGAIVEWLVIIFWIIMGLLMISWALLTTLTMWKFLLYGT